MHITHWVPSSGKNPFWSCIESWINTRYPYRCKHAFVKSPPGNVGAIWNKTVKDFLDSGSDYIFSTHEDVQYHPGTLERLLSWDKPLISALVFMRHAPVLPHVWEQYKGYEQFYALRVKDTREWFYEHKNYIIHGPYLMDKPPANSVVPIVFTSTACTLIHRSVFEKMQEFVGEEWFLMDHEINGGGEDRRFFEYAKIAGVVGYVDRSVGAGHIVGDVPTGPLDFIGWDSISEFFNTGEPDRFHTLETAKRLEEQ